MKKIIRRCFCFALLFGLASCNEAPSTGASSGASTRADDPMANRFKVLKTDGQPAAKEDMEGADDLEGACAQDLFTGLVWEIKTDSPGLHDWRNTYSWYNPKETIALELDYRGTPAAGQCTGSDCDTAAFRQAVNEAGFCGHNDWRIPSRDELASISELQKADSPPTINVDVFRFAQSVEYWSSNDYSFQWNAAWAWNFEFGHDRVDWKKTPKTVRLVRGQGEGLERVED